MTLRVRLLRFQTGIIALDESVTSSFWCSPLRPPMLRLRCGMAPCIWLAYVCSRYFVGKLRQAQVNMAQELCPIHMVLERSSDFSDIPAGDRSNKTKT